MNAKISTKKILFIITRLSKKIWVRVFLYALLGMVTAFIALVVKDFIPDELTAKINTNALDNILTILASSMLTVATFSLSIMVIAFGNVSNNATPRATKLIIQNQSAQRAVATFIGVFLYSIVAKFALATNSYGASGRFILFFVTITVIIVIVATLIKWIDQLSSLGQVGNTIFEIESATHIALKEYAKEPYLGAQKLDFNSISSNSKRYPILSKKVGFLVLIDTKKIQQICEEQNIIISIILLPGSFVYPDQVLASTNKEIDKVCIKSIASFFVIEKSRTFKQDPRFGFLLLSEIASRALSSGINDPGTAIESMASATRLLKIHSDLNKKAMTQKASHAHSRVFIRALEGEEIITLFFAPIIRDGAKLFEIGMKVQKNLKSLKKYDPEYKKACDFYAYFTNTHFKNSLKTKFEIDLVANAWLEES